MVSNIMRQAVDARCAKLCWGTLLVIGSACASAQSEVSVPNETNDSSGGTLAEVVVTAQRREQRLQDVPISIAALSGDKLAAQNAKTFEDYAQNVSSLSFQYVGPTGYRGDRAYAIRGIYGTNTVGYYIDESPVPLLDPQLLDISRIEVLYGPQATLYGSNSMGGTIKIVTNQPSFDAFSGTLDIQGSSTAGGGFNDNESAILNIPIISDILAARLAVGHSRDSGFINNHYDGYLDAPLTFITPLQDNHGTDSDWNTAETNTARLSLRYEPIPGLTISPMGYYSDTKLGAPATYLSGLPHFNTIRFMETPESERVTLGALNSNWSAPSYEITYTLTYFKRTNIAMEDSTQLDVGYVPVTPFGLFTHSPERTVTNEARAQTKFDGMINFLIGGIVSKRNYDGLQNISNPGLSAANPTLPPIPDDILYNGTTVGETSEKSAYWEVRLKLPADVEVIGGARYYKISTEDTASSNGLIALNIVETPSYSESGSRPRVTVSWKPSDDLNIYANYGKGFRPGSPGTLLPAECGGSPLDVVADTVTNYEVGFKASTLGRTLEVSGAVFRMDWANIQQTTLLECGYFVTGNTGNARNDGVELAFNAAPTDFLSINGAATYTRDRITQQAPGQFAYVDDPILFVPTWKANLGVELRHEVVPGYDGILHVGYSYESSVWINYPTSADTLPFARGGFSTLMAEATLRRGPMSYQIFGRNLTNANPITNRYTFAMPPENPLYSTFRPRTIGVRVSYAF